MVLFSPRKKDGQTQVGEVASDISVTATTEGSEDKEYQLSSNNEEMEDESTIEEQEKLEGEVNHAEEVDTLLQEGASV